MNKYEQLIEYIINDETDNARALFHDIVVDKSRDIYESLLTDENDNDNLGGNEVEDLVDEISAEEEGMNEMDDDTGEFASDGDDFDSDGEIDAHEEDHEELADADEESEGENEDLEDRVVDIESALDELQAEFDALMSGDEESTDEFANDENSDMDVDDDAAMYADADNEDEMVREYVEKVAVPKNTSEKSSSVVAGKNDMGGSAKNIAQAGKETTATAAKPKDLKSGNRNVPGGKADKPVAVKAAKTKEEK